uniref:Uncharacterized protein n=1 Tax=Xiphophorus maculatus TaxID=8083 RepID=M4B0E5_XIPMA
MTDGRESPKKVPWWKVFIPKKKNQPERLKDPSSSSKSTTDQTVPAQGSSFLSDETFDDSKLESVFNEQTCRRNMKVSRSGRFKEKRRPRSTLPIEDKGREAAAPGREDKR